MAKVLLSLKWRYFLASFRGNVWVIVGTIFGGLYSLGILAMWAVGSANLGLSHPENEIVYLWLVGFGVLITLLWWVVPFFASGADATLDPERLAPYPLSPRDIQLGQLFGGFVGLTGAATLLATLATSLVLLGKPLFIALYCLGAIPGLLLMVAVSRIVSLVAIEINAIPGIRQALIIIAFLLLIGTGPLIMAFFGAVKATFDVLPQVAGILAWTPLGSAWGFVASAYTGDWLVAVAQYLLTLAYTGLAWWLWQRLLKRAMSRIGVGGRQLSKQANLGHIGIFARFPATARGAVAARTVHTLIKDQRVNLNLIMIPAFYLLLGSFGNIAVGDSGGYTTGMNWFILLFAPVMAGYIYFYLVSYDNSAFSMHVLSPIKGKDERWGRAWGLLLFMLPLVTLGTVFLAYSSGVMHLLPGLLGLSVSLLLTSTGVSAYADMLLSIPAPPPGASPFKIQRQTDGFAKALIRLLVVLINYIFALPGGTLILISIITGDNLLLWLGAAVSLLVGTAVLLLGIWLGSKAYDSSAAETLQRVSAFR